jgi:hypothetical protein
MSIPPIVNATVRRVMELLAQQDYGGLETLTRGVQLSAHDIHRAIGDYGRTVVLPPAAGYALLDVVEVTSKPGHWSVNMPIWTAEEGRSDLTAEMTVMVEQGRLTVELDNIHVL